MPSWRIIKQRGLRKGDRTADGRVVQYVDTEGTAYVDSTVTAVADGMRATMLEKVEKTAGEMTRLERSNIIRLQVGILKTITKDAAGVRNGTLVVKDGVNREDYLHALDIVAKQAVRVLELAKADEMTHECPQCGALTDDPSTGECPECGMRVESNEVKVAPGLTVPMELDGPADAFGNPRRKAGGRLDGARLYEKTAQEIAGAQRRKRAVIL